MSQHARQPDPARLQSALDGLRKMGFEVGDGKVAGEAMTEQEMVDFFDRVSELRQDTDQAPQRD